MCMEFDADGNVLVTLCELLACHEGLSERGRRSQILAVSLVVVTTWTQGRRARERADSSPDATGVASLVGDLDSY